MIDTAMKILHQYPIQALAVAQGVHYFFDCIVDSLGEPQPMSSQWYQFVYRLAHRISGNNSKANKAL